MNAWVYSGGNICPGFNLKAWFCGFPRAEQKSGWVGLTRKPGKALGQGAIPGATVALVNPIPPGRSPLLAGSLDSFTLRKEIGYV